MDKLKVGIVVDQDFRADWGGTYSYYQTLLEGINNHNFDNQITIVNVVFYRKTIPNLKFTKPVVYIKGYLTNGPKSQLAKSVSTGIKSAARSFTIVKDLFAAVEKINLTRIARELARNEIDLIFHLKPVFSNLDYPFITTHCDLAHKSTYAFPELASEVNHAVREHYYANMVDKALLILCESSSSVAEMNYYYHVNPSKLKVLPLCSNNNLNAELTEAPAQQILQQYGLIKNEFFIYPAQFWALKNHYNLIVAFAEMIRDEKFKHFKLVLSGSDQGNLKYIQKVINELKLTSSVITPGFVSNQALSVFYGNAMAMVMPAFLGPTNLPLIEAAQLKCPVLCSDLSGHREIMGGHALYFEPEKPDSIRAAMEEIYTNEAKRTALVESAYTYVTQSKFNLEKSLAALNTILLEIKPVRKAWGIGAT